MLRQKFFWKGILVSRENLFSSACIMNTVFSFFKLVDFTEQVKTTACDLIKYKFCRSFRIPEWAFTFCSWRINITDIIFTMICCYLSSTTPLIWKLTYIYLISPIHKCQKQFYKQLFFCLFVALYSKKKNLYCFN